jgi:POTRA domain, FtsQ-type
VNHGAHRRRAWPKLVLRAALLVAALALTATLAMALVIRRVEIEGARDFPAADVERALQSALGTPTLAARPETLRDAALAVPWVEDARVRVSIDGVVSCSVTERTPAAVEVDGNARVLVGRSGRILGPAAGSRTLIELEGFGPYPEERATLLASAADLAAAWGAPLERAVRLGPRDVELSYAGFGGAVILDPARPSAAASARKVLAAWVADGNAPPLRLDARVPDRVAVLPAQATSAGGTSAVNAETQ